MDHRLARSILTTLNRGSRSLWMAKAKPGYLTFATGNTAAIVALETIKHDTGISMLHVPYRNGRPMSALPSKADIGTQSQNVRFVLSAQSVDVSAQSVDATLALNLVQLGFEAQSLAGPFIELPSHSVELRMRTASGSTTPPWPPH